MSKFNIFLYILFVFLFSCVGGGKKNKKTLPLIVDQNKNCVYSWDIENTNVIWSGFKTTEKIKVTGQFKKFKSRRIHHEYKSVQELVEGLDFIIAAGSSDSGDLIRDLNLKDYFFNLLARNMVISGFLEKIEGDSITVAMDLMGEKKRFKLGFYYDGKTVNIKGFVDLEKQLGAIKAFESIQKKCYDLHKGPDGISKTWKEVEIHIKASILEACN